jgi:hypothetical protein
MSAVLSMAAGDLLIGSTVILGLGTLVAVLAVAPVHRQRGAELSVFATLVWLGLALVPLPRWPALVEVRAVRPAGDAERAASARYAPPASPAGVPGTSAATGASPASPPAAATREAAALAGGDAADRAAAPRTRTWLWRLGLAYAAGSSLVAGYVSLGLVLIRRLLSRSMPPPPWLATLFAERCRALGVRRARLRLTGAPCRPLSVGVVRPTVVLPWVMVERAWSHAMVRVLDHELVHVRRGDGLGRILFAVAAPVLWGHPLFWLLRGRAGLAAELIADDGAAGETGRRAYAVGLLDLAEQLQPLRRAPGIAPGAFRNRSELSRRIEMLIETEVPLATTCTPKRRAVQAAATLIAVGACAAAFGVRSLPAQERARPGMEGSADLPVESVASPRDVASSESGVGRAPADRDARGPGEDSTSSADNPPAAVRPDGDAGPPVAEEETNAGRSAAATTGGLSSRQEPTRPQQEQDAGFVATLALIDRVITLRNELQIARAGFEEGQRVRVRDIQNDPDLMRTVLTIQAHERRLEAVLILVQSEIEATQIEIAQLQRAVALGTEPPSAQAMLVRLAARLKVLQSVL